MENLHKTVSNEVKLLGETEETREEGDFAGVFEARIEEVDSFDESHTLDRGRPWDAPELTANAEALPAAGELEFDEPESVCDRDDRVRILPTTRIPWRWICKLLITRADGSQSVSTGFLIGPRAVVAAGHSVYSPSVGGWARAIEVIPDCDGGGRPFGSQIATSFRTVVAWARDHDLECDYGCIVLPDRTLGNRVGYFGFAALPSSQLLGAFVNVAGYPGDKPFCTLWYNAGPIEGVTARLCYHMIDTFGGQAGSPVWLYRNRCRYVVTIHAHGGCPNKGVRVTASVFRNLLAWRRL